MGRKAKLALSSILAALFVVAVWWGVSGQKMISALQGSLIPELERTLGTPVTVGVVEWTSWNVITLRNLTVYDSRNEVIGKARQASVRVSLLRLLWEQKPVKSIQSVDLTEPELFLSRQASGDWNIEELTRKDLPEGRGFTGKVSVSSGRANITSGNTSRALENIQGWLNFASNPAIRFRITAGQTSAPFSAEGTWAADGFGKMTLHAGGINLADWQEILPAEMRSFQPSGRLAYLELNLNRDKTGLTFNGEMMAAGLGGRYQDWTVSDVKGLIRFSDKSLQLTETIGSINGQAGSAHGRLGKEADGIWRATGEIKVSQGKIGIFDLRDFSVRIEGTADTETAKLRLFDGTGTLARQPLTGLNAVVAGQWGDLRLEGLNAQWGSGTISASGLLSLQGMQLSATGAAVPLAILGPTYPEMGAEGRADVNGTLYGSWQMPMFDLEIRASDGRVFQQPFERASGHLSRQSNQLRISGGELVKGVTVHKIEGTISLIGTNEAALQMTTRRARAEDIVRWIAPGEQLTGNVDNEMTLTGPLNDLQAEGRIRLWEGSFRGYLISRAGGFYQRTAGVITVQNFMIESHRARASASGTLGRNQELNFALKADDVELSRIQVRYPYPVSGQASFIGTLTGTADQPIFHGDLSARTIQLNGQNLYDIAGRLDIEDDQINLTQFRVTEGTGQVSFSGGFNLRTEDVRGSLAVESVEVTSLLAVLNMPVKGIAGRLSGMIDLSGSLSNPALQIIGDLSGGRIKGYRLDTISVDVLVKNKFLTVNRFEAKQGSGFLVAQGTADWNGLVNLDIGGKDIDAGLLTAWLDSAIETQGKMDFTAQMRGTAANPQLAVSLEIRGGGVASATFDFLYGMFQVDQQAIQVNQLFISKGSHKASAYGLIPLNALNPSGREKASAADYMDLRIKLDQADLGILPLLTREAEWASGPTSGEILISGTLVKPVLSGHITVENGKVKLKSLLDPIEAVDVDIRFEDDRMKVAKFSGTLGGGTFSVEGELAFNGIGLRAYRGELVLNHLGVRHKYFKGPLDGRLELAEVKGNPRLSGKIILQDDTISVPLIPEAFTTDLAFDLDVDLILGNKLRLYASSLYDLYVDGQFHFGGTLKTPRITGKANVQRGTVDYLNTRFRVVEGSAEFPSTRLLDPQLHLTAQAHLSQTLVFLTINGPVSDMQLRLSSQPALSQQEIRMVLALRGRAGDPQYVGIGNSDLLGREEFMGLLQTGLRMQMLGEVERSLQNTFGLDDFRIVSATRTANSTSQNSISYGGVDRDLREVYNIEASKYIGDKVEVTYSMGIDHNEYTATVRYDVTKQFSISASTDERNRNRVGVDLRIRF